MSKLFARASRLSLSRNGASTSPSVPTGTFTKKIHSQLSASVSAAEQNARDGAERSDCAPRAEGGVAFLPLGEGGREDRQRRRSDQRCAEPLEGAGADQ